MDLAVLPETIRYKLTNNPDSPVFVYRPMSSVERMEWVSYISSLTEVVPSEDEDGVDEMIVSPVSLTRLLDIFRKHVVAIEGLTVAGAEFDVENEEHLQSLAHKTSHIVDVGYAIARAAGLGDEEGNLD